MSAVTLRSGEGQVNLEVREKTRFAFNINFLLSAAAYNISSYTFVAEFYKVGATTPFITLTQGTGITNNGATGILNLVLTDTQLTITPDQYYWKLKITSPTAEVWFNGSVTVKGYLWDGAVSTGVTVALTLGGDTLSVNITLGGTGVATSIGITNWAGTITCPTATGFGEIYKITNAAGCDVPLGGGSVFFPFDSIILSKAAGSAADNFWVLA